ncbi:MULTISPECIES: VanZ family protein [unclassified Paenibacillus]|uniref:VanZ family protein n=1 Tax=unclassified Paenibacillus TaxID=185978 RepID=UPI001AE46897|nr:MULTISPECIES: VanZ family protein [unclassified Paenibacillus]MBP1154410.1 VanZ family protein [Paenibacillus sp. PvP091]MBP1170206.1 VanZ family protein [Paenibacillus sp. PvR098]MBP2441234.1 VanZ family protein [Paenibacillus sp. PvP052]
MQTKPVNRSRFFWTHVLPLLVWMAVIFLFSSQSYEKQDLRPLLHNQLPEQLIVKHLSDVRLYYGGSEVSIRAKGVPSFVEFFIRKSAHLFIYMVLGFLTLRLAAVFVERKLWLLAVYSLLFCSLYAVLDELHQMITPHRTSMLTDVLLDTCGAGIGILIYVVFTRIRHKYGKGA